MSLLDEFYASLGSSSQIEFHEKFMPAQYRGELYHYTSPAGLTSILLGDPKAMTLWASRYDVLNDTTEGEVAAKVYKEVCEEIEAPDGINLSAIAPTRTYLMQTTFNGKSKITRPECERYVCCFSKDVDSLPMWNYYAKGNAYEGYNIEVDTARLNDSLLRNWQGIEVSSEIYPVIYDEGEQRSLVKSFLQTVLSQYSASHASSVKYAISNQLDMWRLVFKSKYFEHENEVRVIVRVARSTTTKKSPVAIKYRTKGMYVVPYIEMKLDKSCVLSVIIGPQQWNEQQKKHQSECIANLLKENQYSATVSCSEAPVRY